MFLSDIPARVAIPFANGAGSSYIRDIPVPSQTGGAASFTDGFPADTFTPLSGGGAYVNGEDVNGILNHVTKWTRWMAAGGPATFNSAFATAVGGYPKLATLQSTAQPGVEWLNTVDGNLTDPDGGGAVGWVLVGPAKASQGEVNAGTEPNKYVTPATLHTLLGAVVPVAATLAEAQTGTNNTDFITSLVLRQLQGFTAVGDGGYIDFGATRIVVGRHRLTTDRVDLVFTCTYCAPFAGTAYGVAQFRYDASGRTYNQKNYVKASDGDGTGFTYRIQDTDSGDPGSYVYGFDYIAIGPKP